MLTYVVIIHSYPNNTYSIVYHLMIVRYSMKTLHWYFPKATALHLSNMTDKGGKLQQLHYYHPSFDSRDICLTKNHYENYSHKMVPIVKIWGSGSWTIWVVLSFAVTAPWPRAYLTGMPPMLHRCSPWGSDVSFTIPMSKVKIIWVI